MMIENYELVDNDLVDNDQQALLESDDGDNESDQDSNVYGKAINACGFGLFNVLVLTVSGWALASDSVEMQVVSFVLPSACDLEMTSYQKGWLNATIFIGMMLGGYLFGGAADMKGRRYVLCWSMSINGLFGLASAFAPNYALFLVLRLLSGIGVGAAMPILFTYCAEFMSADRRGPAIGCLAGFWMIGNLLSCIFAWLIIPHVELGRPLSYIVFSSWRIYVVIGALPALSSACFFYFMPESPLYLQKAGEYDEAYTILVEMFRRNKGKKTPIPAAIKNFSDYHQSAAAGKKEKSIRNVPDLRTFSRQVQELVKTFTEVVKASKRLFVKPLLSTTLMLIIIWCTLSFGFYGLWMWLPEIFKRIESGGGSGCSNVVVVIQNVTSNLTCREITAQQREIYIESLAIALSNFPGNFLTIIFVNRVGRRPLMAVSMILAAVSVFFFPLVSSRLGMVALLCIFSGTSVGGWNVLDMLAIENYPTDLRSTAFGVQSVFGRIAAICGNLAFGAMVDQHCAIPIILVSLLLAVGGLTSLKLPKTDNIPLG